MLKRQYYVTLGVLVVLVLIVLNLPQHVSSRLKLAIGGFFLPLFGIAGSTQSAAKKTGDVIVPRKDLVRELDQARQEIEHLRLQLRQGEDTLRENAQLRQFLDYQKLVPWKLKAARVIGRDPANWWRTVFIDLGSRHGMREDLPVLTPDGLVGRVSSVGLLRSQVTLLGDPNCRVSAVIKETGDNGFIGPNAASLLDNSFVNLNHLARTAPVKQGQTVVSGGLELKPGQTVLSSGQGGVFPKGIPIGQVADTRSVGYGLNTEARVKLFVNLNALDNVWVLLP